MYPILEQNYFKYFNQIFKTTAVKDTFSTFSLLSFTNLLNFYMFLKYVVYNLLEENESEYFLAIFEYIIKKNTKSKAQCFFFLLILPLEVKLNAFLMNLIFKKSTIKIVSFTPLFWFVFINSAWNTFSFMPYLCKYIFPYLDVIRKGLYIRKSNLFLFKPIAKTITKKIYLNFENQKDTFIDRSLNWFYFSSKEFCIFIKCFCFNFFSFKNGYLKSN